MNRAKRPVYARAARQAMTRGRLRDGCAANEATGSTEDERPEAMLVALAQKIRAAVNMEKGVIDLRACLGVADSLEFAARLGDRSSGSGHAKCDCPQVAIDRPTNLGTDEKFEAALDLLRIFEFPSIRHGYCLNCFLAAPGILVRYEEVRNRIGCTHLGVKVYVSHVRGQLAAMGFESAIVNVRGKGYYMPPEIETAMNAHIRSFQGVPSR